jgi:2-dehydropantoate 2-reductase
MKIAIYGAGSLGTALGAYISRAGTPIELVNRNQAHVDALNKQGATVTGTVSFNTPVTAITPDQMQGPYDLIFLMTKQQHNEEVVTFLKPLLAEDGIICTMQNGMPEPDIATIIGQNRVMGCAVAWGATLLEPGHVELTSSKESMNVSLGRLNGEVDDKLTQVRQVLELMCPVEVEPNFMGVRWSKLLINASFSGMSVVLGGTYGDVADDKRARLCAQRVIKECIDVAHCAGIKIEPVQGKNIEKLLDYHGALKQKISFFIIPLAIKKHRLIRASMLQDIEHGKKTEIDFINGVVSDCGRQVDVPTPYNDKIVAIVHDIEEGKLTPSAKNLDLFDALA